MVEVKIGTKILSIDVKERFKEELMDFGLEHLARIYPNYLKNGEQEYKEKQSLLEKKLKDIDHKEEITVYVMPNIDSDNYPQYKLNITELGDFLAEKDIYFHFLTWGFIEAIMNKNQIKELMQKPSIHSVVEWYDLNPDCSF
ncbi:MAG: hypothetical protein KKA65_01065 [Nanoarchaeota archaeon]|nr:hypothetical protein [Nanoarchaeota archaeon]MBU4242104.1 hypothetical protein [Nanoarchaeota archaeon]MBU4352404.1 hypothetical protein [Nanoarchaeota archaeon]MBU4456069.1 hypothetical protein [Nanoarchaeota archaeon]MCG2720302.1 hypothetical protein [Nanoarchaeota archaeon]